MPHFCHDNFAKSYLTELLNTIGKTTPDRRINAEAREGDLWFEIRAKAKKNRDALGLLGQLLTRNSLIEVFRNPATAAEIRACQGKLYAIEDTIFLRILGREGNQRQAIEEFVQLPTGNDLRANIEEILTDYRAELASLSQTLTPEEEELIMNLSAAYLKKQQEWLQEGVQQKSRAVAVAALREGISSELIARLTGLTIAEIEQLRSSHSN